MNATDYLNEPLGSLRVGDCVHHRDKDVVRMHITRIGAAEKMATCIFFDGVEQVEASFPLADLILDRSV